jgi:hypothetical protein
MKRLAILALVGCGGGASGDSRELITRVTLAFTTAGATTTFTFDDPDGDGGEPPTVQPVMLANGTPYSLAITFTNALEDPPEDITAEVRDEGDQHQVFLTGTAVDGPATNNPTGPLEHTYTDMDINGLPIGLSNGIATTSGAGMLTVTLRHMPPVNDMPTKAVDTAMKVKNGGLTAISGENDANVTFMVTVQ